MIFFVFICIIIVGEGARVSDFFFTKDPNLKKNCVYVCVCVVVVVVVGVVGGGGGGVEGTRVSEFIFTKNPN